VKPGDGSDAVIVNTCAVTAESVRKSRQAIRNMKKLEPNAVVAVFGCFAKLEPESIKALGADIIGNPGNEEMFVTGLEGFVEKEVESQNETQPQSDRKSDRKSDPKNRPLAPQRTRALLKIQDGCNNYCAYCVIPYVRGRSRSLPLERIADKAKMLQAQGYKEIVITGIEISVYGKDFSDPQEPQERPQEPQEPQEPSLSAKLQPSPNPQNPDPETLMTAIQTIGAAAPDVRLRLGSLDPAAVTDEFIRKLSEIPNLCNHFHLSLQSGCNETLQRMGRKYSTESVMKTISSLRNRFENCGITADVIVGFPGESDREFEQTVEFIKKAAFTDMHIFPYSPRAGTKAASMPGQIDKNIKKERARIIAGVVSALKNEFLQAQVGKITEVLFEQSKNGFSMGYSRNYLQIAVEGKIDRNSIYTVEITGTEDGQIIGVIR
jgi:threonylcarbamoyladenosine tRNA methylthiotransferase MtaB